MAIHPKTVRLLTEWLTTTDELRTEVANFNALYEPGVFEIDGFMQNFPMLHVRRLVLSHASSPNILHVAQDVATGEFVAVVIVGDSDVGSVAEMENVQNERRYQR